MNYSRINSILTSHLCIGKIALLFFACSTHTHAALVVYEGFDYPPPALNEANGGFGWRGPWQSTAQLNVDSVAFVKTGSLTTPDNYPTTFGNRLILTDDSGGQMVAYRGLATDAFIDLRKNGIYYFAFIVRRSSSGYLINLTQGASTPVLSISVSTAGAITLNLAGEVVSSGNVIANNFSNLFVIKIEANADGPDVVSLNRYADSQSLPNEEPNIWLLTVESEVDLFAERLALHGGSNRTIEFDEIRIGTSWDSTLYQLPTFFGMTLEQSQDLSNWSPILITPEMVGSDGRISPPDVNGSNFFRMRIEALED